MRSAPTQRPTPLRVHVAALRTTADADAAALPDDLPMPQTANDNVPDCHPIVLAPTAEAERACVDALLASAQLLVAITTQAPEAAYSTWPSQLAERAAEPYGPRYITDTCG